MGKYAAYMLREGMIKGWWREEKGRGLTKVKKNVRPREHFKVGTIVWSRWFQSIWWKQLKISRNLPPKHSFGGKEIPWSLESPIFVWSSNYSKELLKQSHRGHFGNFIGPVGTVNF